MKIIAAAAIALCFLSGPAVADTPRLILQITVDGLRGDLLDRYAENFVEGGFNYLRKNGVV